MTERDGDLPENIVPNELDTDDDSQKGVAGTEKMIRNELERQLAISSGAVGSTESQTTSDRELPIPDYDELSVRGAKVRLDGLNPDQLRFLRSYEAEHKMRKTVIREIDRRLR